MFAVLAYLVHLWFALLQLLLAPILLVGGAIRLSGHVRDEVVPGVLYTLAGVTLSSAVLFDPHFMLSGSATLLGLMVLGWQLRRRQILLPWVGRWLAPVTMVLAGAVGSFGLFEQADPLALARQISDTAFEYAQLEADWTSAREPAAPNVGDLAPDFALADPGGAATMRLSSYRDRKPLLLIFGAHT